MPALLVKGRHRPEKCFQLVAPVDSPKAEQIRLVSLLFTQGLHAYRGQRWDEAEEQFRAALAVWPDDTPSAVFIERCRGFRANPPGDGWDGVFEMKTK